MKFFEAAHPPHVYDAQHWQGISGISEEQARQIVDGFKQERVYLSDCGTYQAHLRPVDTGNGWPNMLHISFKRCDKQPIGDWRIKQEIKNAIVGPECEGVELFPAESRLVDTSNQYHLWCFVEPGVRFPFGYEERLVLAPGEGPAVPGAVQRPFDDAGEVFCLPDDNGDPEWQIRIGGQVLPTTWTTKGAALAGLECERRRRAEQRV